jgi:trigger factor
MAETDTDPAPTEPSPGIDESLDSVASTAGAESESGAAALQVEYDVQPRGACQRHVVVTVPRAEIDRYFEQAFDEMMPTAQVRGFRPGKAPRKLVVARYRQEVAEQVKSRILLDGVTAVVEKSGLVPIGEPEMDPTAIQLPDEGPLVFEFDLEVRPDFELPEWRGLKIRRPSREFTEADVDNRLKDVLASHGTLVPSQQPAAPGDFVAVDITFRHGDEELSVLEEEVVCLRPTLSFQDGNITDFDRLMTGVRPGDTRTATVRLSDAAANAALAGEEVTAEIKVLDVKRLQLPEMTPSFLQELGGFSNEDELRDAVRQSLQRQLQYEQRRRVREQITQALVESANWELPQTLLRRQATRELQRAVLELRRSGFSENEIRAHENQLRQHSLAATARALQEHFILERLAEDQKIDASDDELQSEVALIALQSGESPRRVWARLEKSGQLDAVRNQVVERKVIELILSHAQLEDEPYTPPRPKVEAVQFAIAGAAPEEAAEGGEAAQQEETASAS